jgi:hypothetical protein
VVKLPVVKKSPPCRSAPAIRLKESDLRENGHTPRRRRKAWSAWGIFAAAPSRDRATAAGRIVTEAELPKGFVSTARLHVHFEAEGMGPISSAKLARWKAAGAITPHPLLRVCSGNGRPSDAWHLAETIAAARASEEKR